MDSRTLKRLFPFIAGGPCTGDQAAVLALCATSDKVRVVGDVALTDEEDSKRMLAVIGLALQGQPSALEARQRLVEAEERVAAMNARLEALQKQARELEQRFDRELFALEREAVSLVKSDAKTMMFDAFDPFSIRKALSRPGQVKVVNGKTVRVLPDEVEVAEQGRSAPVPWDNHARAKAEDDLNKAREKAKLAMSPSAVLVRPDGGIGLSANKVLALGDKTITLTEAGRITIPPGAPTVHYRVYGFGSRAGDTPQIDIALTRALFYLAKEGILERIK
jgi:hypothetical protein